MAAVRGLVQHLCLVVALMNVTVKLFTLTHMDWKGDQYSAHLLVPFMLVLITDSEPLVMSSL